MTPEIGHYALIMAFLLAIVQATLPLLGTFTGRAAWMRVARPTAYGQFLFIGIAFVILAHAFLTNDFSVAYVAMNSNRALPDFYKFCAIWGAHEGSMLLWVFVLSIWMCAVALFSRQLPLETVARVLAVMGMISVGFMLFFLATSDPFTRILPNIPINGRDLNPLLQDPGLAIHPPMLYMGYVGFSVAYAFAIAALISGRLDAAWARWSRPWTTAAWCFLTFGITLGSWWAYRELGWGGWWFWDPVENASFLPWLVGTALIHSLAVSEKRNTFKAWTVLLAILAFTLSLLGTFLVRSGVLISVHSFATDPTRGAYMLALLVVAIGASLALYAWRAHSLTSKVSFNFFSRETMLFSNNIILIVVMVTILLGTLYPLIIEGLKLGKISVGPPYFNAVFIPLMVPLLLLMGPGPLFRWKQTNPMMLVKRLWLTLIISILFAFLFPWLVVGKLQWQTVTAMGIASWIILATLQNFVYRKNGRFRLNKLTRSQVGMVFAHIGMAVCVMGVVFTSMYSVERNVKMQIGNSITIAPYEFTLLAVNGITGPNYKGVEGNVAVSKDGRRIALLKPQVRLYTVQQTTLSKTAIDIGVFRDLYVALAEPLGNDTWALRIYDKPFVRWIWYGGLLMFLGGGLAVSDRRYYKKFRHKN